MSQTKETGTLLLRLRQELENYSPTLSKLGSFVLQQPQHVLYLTITELARESHTSEASVTRLCRQLGCKGFSEFKMGLAMETRQSQASQPIEGDDEVQTLIEDSVNALRDTGKLLDRQTLGNAAMQIHNARSVQIYGVAASAIVADYLGYKLLRLGKASQCFSDMHRAAMNAVSLDSQDIVVVISSSGSTKDVLHAVELAQQQGTKIIGISNTLRSPLSSLADILLVAAKPEGPLTAGLLTSKVGGMLLVELLINQLITISPSYVQASQHSASATLSLLL
ncbi:MurR/RpiR family transcriptional regulator [Yersinia mollaretii]|uniref:MurR/RpiR family transcriptional regulator n=1 Tax=Yersinia mollaretii TaxID=33060 RepID=A0AA44CI90_YERMO|nr:MurR/RpiR family transcriptional regulator [Yersinia mollaretii]CNL15262.1 rpiR family transcriptional regulatory protein [Yersinia enterocolitica]NIL21263.1 MurR/RpiR family transcriptional regulator [Yersinia mollaretii]CNI27070.1 rpiR family transcriptional regulatory protein [Yersinia mollaretii]CNJ80529.1 rpiR family transcriptional regulatory protein [Yersinia mollaretii]CQQ28322.1 rpiR family transcriptional regulatory protein [Yersinia mollaretii]